MGPEGDSRFLQAVADALTEHLAVIDADGVIVWVNRAWVDFGRRNGAPEDADWIGTGYLETCRPVTGPDDPDARRAFDGLSEVLAGRARSFSFEYPCDGDGAQRWFLMRATPLAVAGPPLFVVSHQDITQRKAAEDRAVALAMHDQLTGVPNRRRFEEFLQAEWRRARRLAEPISLAMIDVDRFKAYNDRNGHLAGDECLRRVAACLGSLARRPGDLLARFGGEEFALVLADTPAERAHEIAETARTAVGALEVPGGSVTVSAGVSTIVPGRRRDPVALIHEADRRLYAAKAAGRDRVCGPEADATAPVLV